MTRVAAKQDWEKEVPADVPEELRLKYWEQKNWGHCGHGAWKRRLKECFKQALDSYYHPKVIETIEFERLVGDPDFWLFLLRAVDSEEEKHV